MLNKDIIRLRHVLDAIEKALEFTKGKTRLDVIEDEILALALVRLREAKLSRSSQYFASRGGRDGRV